MSYSHSPFISLALVLKDTIFTHTPPPLVWECTCLAPLLFHDLVLVPVPGSTEILPKWASLPDPHTLPQFHCKIRPAHTLSDGAPLVASELDLLTYFPLVLPALGSCTTLLKLAGTRSPHQGISPALLALGAIRACVSGSQRTETIRESVFRLPPPGHSTDSSLTHTHSSHVKEPIYLSWSFSLRDRFQVYHTSRGHKDALRECRPTLHSTLALLSPPVFPKKEAYTLVWSPDFCNCCQEDTSKLPSLQTRQGAPGGSDGKESACSAGELGLIPGLGRSPGEGNGYPLQYSCLENLMDRGIWWATVHGTSESQT